MKALRSIGYSVAAGCLLMFNGKRREPTVFYVKNYGLIPGLRLVKRIVRPDASILFEAHVPPRTRLQKWAVRHVEGIVCNGRTIERVLLKSGILRQSRHISVHQGYDSSSYPVGDRAKARSEARIRLNWNDEDWIAAYTGKVYWPYAEIELLVQAATELSTDGFRLVVVGGRADHAQVWQDHVRERGIDNVTFTGFVAPADIVDYQVGADSLLSYYPSGLELNKYRSPGKLFEYMASGTPIIAADYPSLREVLRNQQNAVLIEPNKAKALAQAIRLLMRDGSLAARLGDQARKDVADYTWSARAKTISEFALRLSQL